MSNVELAFVILNCVLFGAVMVLRREMVAAQAKVVEGIAEATRVKDVSLEASKMIAEAHNSMAKRLLEIEDKQKAAELRATGTRAFVPMKA